MLLDFQHRCDVGKELCRLLFKCSVARARDTLNGLLLNYIPETFFFLCDIEAWNVGAATIPVGVPPMPHFTSAWPKVQRKAGDSRRPPLTRVQKAWQCGHHTGRGRPLLASGITSVWFGPPPPLTNLVILKDPSLIPRTFSFTVCPYLATSVNIQLLPKNSGQKWIHQEICYHKQLWSLHLANAVLLWNHLYQNGTMARSPLDGNGTLCVCSRWSGE